jgi:hypothetical protein
MLILMALLTFGMLLTLVVVMAGAEAPPVQAHVRKGGARVRTRK